MTSAKTATRTRSARDLFARLAPFGPGADGDALTFAAELPDDLTAAVQVLHTGVRAVLTGRAWWGCLPTGMSVRLDPAALIPPGVYLLSVEGRGERWDRICPFARFDLPELFATD